MQRIEIIGNLAKDAVQVEGQDGRPPFLSFTVICNEKRGDSEFKVPYEVMSTVSRIQEFLKKGKQVFVTGIPSAKAYLNKDGQATAQMRISAHSVELL